MLEETLKQNNLFLYDLLAKGLSREEIIGKLQKIGLSPNESLIKLFSWKNGIEHAEEYTIGELQLFTLGIFESLELAIEKYEYMALEHDYWQRGLFPVFNSCGGDYYLINLCNKEFKEDAIYMYSPSLLFLEPEYTFRDLDSVLKLVVDCYNDGTYKFDGELLVDIDKEEIAFNNAK
jgi:hypothetical protein